MLVKIARFTVFLAGAMIAASLSVSAGDLPVDKDRQSFVCDPATQCMMRRAGQTGKRSGIRWNGLDAFVAGSNRPLTITENVALRAMALLPLSNQTVDDSH